MKSPFQNVGRCLYCDSTQSPLTREHVLPRGLGGNVPPDASSDAIVLLNASCEECREITRRLEEDCLSGMMGPARARLKMNRRDRAKATRPAKITYRDGTQAADELPIEYIPAAMIIPSFPTAGVFCGDNWNPGPIDLMQMILDEERRLQNPQIREITLTLRYNVSSYSRMICKIALGIARYNFGPDAFNSIVGEYIRTGNANSNFFVGGYRGLSNSPADVDSLHRISLWHHNNHIVVTIQLFASVNGPVNYSVVGVLNHMPPRLPPLPLGLPLPPQSKTADQFQTTGPKGLIRWDQTSP